MGSLAVSSKLSFVCTNRKCARQFIYELVNWLQDSRRESTSRKEIATVCFQQGLKFKSLLFQQIPSCAFSYVLLMAHAL